MGKIIGITGKLGTGKDYLAEQYLCKYLDSINIRWLRLSFADQIKVNVMSFMDIPFDNLYKQKTSESRKLLQQEGTENGRNKYGEDIWNKFLKNWCNVHFSRGIQIIIVSDVRFLNEFNLIKELNGLMLKVIAPQRNELKLQQESQGNLQIYNSIKQHTSETQLDLIPEHLFDYIIYNDPNDDINNVLNTIFQHIYQSMF